MEHRVKLKGVLKQTASSAEIKSDGSLVIGLYDFSDDAQNWLGNDVAFLLTISPDDKSKMLSRLTAGQNPTPVAADDDALLLRLIAERFDDYYAVKHWLEENNIQYRKDFDSWA